MIYALLNTLPWLLATVTFSESLTLEVSDSVPAECGKPLVLHCNISSSLTGLTIKHMEWCQSNNCCSVDSEGYVTSTAEEDFYCQFDKGHLSLHFYKWSPWLFKSSFRCKLRSNQGILHQYTHVETREQWQSVKAEWVSISPSCNFRKVCPGGEVEWFQGSRRITDQSLITTDKYVEAGSWIAINSYLNVHKGDEPYNCTLRSSSSGQYLTSAVIRPPLYVRARATTHGPVWSSLWTIVGFYAKDFFLRFV